jgi:hypothetical protein
LTFKRTVHVCHASLLLAAVYLIRLQWMWMSS